MCPRKWEARAAGPAVGVGPTSLGFWKLIRFLGRSGLPLGSYLPGLGKDGSWHFVPILPGSEATINHQRVRDEALTVPLHALVNFPVSPDKPALWLRDALFFIHNAPDTNTVDFFHTSNLF